MENIHFVLSWSEDTLEIEVSNLATKAAAESLRHHIVQIAEAANPEDLYMERLHELLADRTKRGGLGLYRIAFEGGFGLKFDHDGNRVRIVATRRLR
jgi:hypothetical protein